MITKEELREQIESICSDWILDGDKVKSVLKELPEEVTIYWGNIPESVLNDTF